MDWANERYVRLYTRDTLTWRRWSWESRAVFCLLLRKVDRSGVMDTESMGAAEAIAIMADVPPSVAESALVEWEMTGSVVVVDGQITIPTFLDAQEAAQSDAQRARDSRARRRDGASRNVTDCHAESQHVTDGHRASLLPSLPSSPTNLPSGTVENASRPDKPASPSRVDPIVAELPLRNGNGWSLRSTLVASLSELYPRVDAGAQVKRMRVWLDANPSKRKTARGMGKFVSGWIQRESERVESEGDTGRSSSRDVTQFNALIALEPS